jgi:hypothetical protein
VDGEVLIQEWADRLRSVVPDGFHLTVGPDGTVWFSCDEGRVPGQRGHFKSRMAGTHLREALLTEGGTDTERAATAARSGLDDLQVHVDEASHQRRRDGIDHAAPGPRSARDGLRCRSVDGEEVVPELSRALSSEHVPEMSA